MGKRYSYKIITNSANIGGLVGDLCAAVIQSNALEIQKCLPLKHCGKVETDFGFIEYGIDGIKEERWGNSENHYCFSLPLPDSYESGEQSYIGCVWSSLYKGPKWSMLEIWAATSAISLEFAKEKFKRNIVKLFPSSVYLLFNDETEEEEILVPKIGRHKIDPEDKHNVEELVWTVNVNWLGDYLEECFQ